MLENKFHKNVVGVSRYILHLHRYGRSLQVKSKRSSSLVLKVKLKVVRIMHRVLCSYVGCYIPFGAKICRGIVLPHGFYGVFLSKHCKINFGVTILHQVTIGSNPLSCKNSAPIIESGAFVGAGAKIIGDVRVPCRSVVSVNQVVTKTSMRVDNQLCSS
jgi:serine acetyltransferase